MIVWARKKYPISSCCCWFFPLFWSWIMFVYTQNDKHWLINWKQKLLRHHLFTCNVSAFVNNKKLTSSHLKFNWSYFYIKFSIEFWSWDFLAFCEKFNDLTGSIMVCRIAFVLKMAVTFLFYGFNSISHFGWLIQK